MANNEFSQEQFGAMRTAFLTAYPKIFTNINYSMEIFGNMKELALKEGFAFAPNLFNNEMSVEIEARHKALSKALKKQLTSDSLVIEIAAGMSPRHLEFSEYNYVEVDFKPVMDIKSKIYKLIGKGELSKSLYAVDLSNVERLREFLNKIVKTKKFSKIIIVNEGLFWYLTKEQIATMTNEFTKAFTSLNWMWITSDCPPTDRCDDDYRKVISSSAKVKRGTFADYADFTKFFESLGLSNVRCKLSDLIKYQDLTSARLFSVEEKDAVKKIDSYTDISVLRKSKTTRK